MAAAARGSEDVRIEILCEKLKEADLSVQERDDLADDLRRAEQCDDPSAKDILISNIRRAMSEPVRMRRELEGALDRHEATCVRAGALEVSIKDLHKKCEEIHEEVRGRSGASAVEIPLPKVLGGKVVRVSGGAVYLLIFVVAVMVFMHVNSGRRSSDFESLKSELTRLYAPASSGEARPVHQTHERQ